MLQNRERVLCVHHAVVVHIAVAVAELAEHNGIFALFMNFKPACIAVFVNFHIVDKHELFADFLVQIREFARICRAEANVKLRLFGDTVITREVANAYALWIAEYGDRLNYSGNYGVWQYTGSGSVSGVTTIVDKDYCYINYPEIIKNAGLNGFGEPTSPLKPITEIALEVIRGDWGSGEERKIRLTEAGYDYYAVQREVERILKRPKARENDING